MQLMNNSIFSSDSMFLLLKGQHFSYKYCRDWERGQLSSHWSCWSM